MQAWLNAGIDPATVGYMEAHGTGTKLGDPIEIEGITRAFRRFTDRRQFCGIGSVKTNLGHLDNAAGIVGLVKAVLALKRGELPPSLHFRRPNRHIDFIDSPVYVNDRLAEWPAGTAPRRCGVSAFGLSGTNCHVVLEEAPKGAVERLLPEGESQEGTSPCLFVLSARSAESLARSVRAYAERLGRSKQPELADLCCTASTGRGHYEYRLGAIVSDVPELARLLREASALPPERLGEAGVYYGDGRAVPKSTPTSLAEARALADRAAETEDAAELTLLLGRIGFMYAEGADIPWGRLYRRQRRRKVHLPPYSFDRIRCWAEGSSEPSLGNVDAVRRSSTGSADKGRFATGISDSGDPSAAEKRQFADEPDVERTVADAWASVLGVRPHPDDDFFALGGHSLAAVQVTAVLGRELGVELSLDQLFLSPTVTTLSEVIRRLKPNGPGPAKEPLKPDIIEPREPRQRYPVSSAQKRLFIMQELEPTSVTYNMPALLQIDGPVDEERLQETLRIITERHESLRTTFCWWEGEIVQTVHPHADLSFTKLEAGNGESEAVARSFVRPFRLDILPLLRIGLLRQPNGTFLLLFDMHHIVSDGTSIARLAGEFATLYSGGSLPPLTVQYRDYAVWLRDREDDGPAAAHREYWSKVFARTVPKLALPFVLRDKSKEAFSSREGATLFFRADAILSRKLSELAASTGTTVFMVLLAAYNVLLARYTGQEDIVVGTAVAGRTRAELEPLIGMFVNTLPLRHYPAGDMTFRQFLAEVRRNTREALEHQEYPFERLLDELRDAGDPAAGEALFDTMYVHQNAEPPVLRFGDVTLRARPFDFGIAKFDLTLQSWPQDAELAFSLEYRTTRFRREEISLLPEHFIRLLHLAAADDFLIREADLLAPEERARMKERISHSKKSVFADFDF